MEMDVFGDIGKAYDWISANATISNVRTSKIAIIIDLDVLWLSITVSPLRIQLSHQVSYISVWNIFFHILYLLLAEFPAIMYSYPFLYIYQSSNNLPAWPQSLLFLWIKIYATTYSLWCVVFPWLFTFFSLTATLPPFTVFQQDYWLGGNLLQVRCKAAILPLPPLPMGG